MYRLKVFFLEWTNSNWSINLKNKNSIQTLKIEIKWWFSGAFKKWNLSESHFRKFQSFLWVCFPCENHNIIQMFMWKICYLHQSNGWMCSMNKNNHLHSVVIRTKMHSEKWNRISYICLYVCQWRIQLTYRNYW